ncbi:MAG: iron ABC transporter permease [Lachnospiraceae bacterium]|nr:iron ABC transporter permease [Lachnospiraceae bacterium]
MGTKAKKSRNNIIRIYFVGAAVLLVLAVLLSLCLGSARLSLSEVWQAVCAGPRSGPAGRIFWYARLPRTGACLLAGAALAVSGAVIQGVLANKLASPGIIGVNAGAGLAVTVCCAFGSFGGWLIAGAAFGGAVLAVLLVALTAEKIGASRTTVILGGVAVNSCLNAASEAISVLLPDAGMQSADFRVGGFSAVAFTRLLPAGILIVVGLALLFTLCNDLDVIGLGEDTAQGLGMPVKRTRTIFLILAALLSGAAVSFAGLLGFVGLIVPHMGRRLVSNESGKLLPFCALAGAGLVTLCDLLARTLFMPYEIPVGILLAFVGGPFFLTLLIRRKGGHSL